MAKVSLSKIIPIKKMDDVVVDINGEQVVIKQYLPVDEKVALVERVLNASIDETNYFSYAKLNVYSQIEIVKAYTNISFTEKQLEDIPKLFDLLIINGIIKIVKDNIPYAEYINIHDMIYDDADRLGKHLNSFLGVMKVVQQDYDLTKMNVDNLMNTLGDKESVGLVKDILDKIG